MFMKAKLETRREQDWEFHAPQNDINIISGPSTQPLINRSESATSQTQCSNCWIATRALECSRAPGMSHNLRVRPKRTSIIISNDNHKFAMVENVGLIIGQ